MQIHIEEKYRSRLVQALGGSLAMLQTLYSFDIPDFDDKQKRRVEAWIISKDIYEYMKITGLETRKFYFAKISLIEYLQAIDSRSQPDPIIRLLTDSSILLKKNRSKLILVLANYVVIVQGILSNNQRLSNSQKIMNLETELATLNQKVDSLTGLIAKVADAESNEIEGVTY